MSQTTPQHPDFDRLFRRYAREQLGTTKLPEAGLYPVLQDPASAPWLDELEDLYARWNQAVLPTYGQPGVFFAHLTPQELVAALVFYVGQRWAVPLTLLDTLADNAEAGEALEWLLNRDWDSLPHRLVLLALELLLEHNRVPVACCVAYLHGQVVENALSAQLVAALIYAGADALPAIEEALDDACAPYGRLCLLEALCEIGLESGSTAPISARLEEAFFLSESAERQEIARMMAKLGEDSLLPVLREAMTQAADAQEYYALKDAAEVLGYFTDIDPEAFTDEPDDGGADL